MSITLGTQKYWGIIRCSTQKQKLGLLSQKEQIENAVAQKGGVIVGWTSENISGTTEVQDRKNILKVLDYCKFQQIICVVADVSRLARNQHALHTFLKVGAKIWFLDCPDVDPTLLAIYGSFAEKFCQVNSAKTSAGMRQSAITKGIKFGTQREHTHSVRDGRKLKPVVKVSAEARARGQKLAMANRMESAKNRWQHLKDRILDYRKSGYSFQAIADFLNNGDSKLNEDKELTKAVHPYTGGKFYSAGLWAAMKYFVEPAEQDKIRTRTRKALKKAN